ncbi:MAG: hypothetical protein ACRENX_02870 [Candidatus Dormibacteria bacterium]
MAIVTATIPKSVKLGSADWVFEVNVRGQKIGQLQLSAGTVDWWPVGNFERRTTLTWRAFGKFMEEVESSSNARPRRRAYVRHRAG